MEDTATALFKHWFIDFEFPKKMENRINQAEEKWWNRRWD
jgi:hypothetical protein